MDVLQRLRALLPDEDPARLDAEHPLSQDLVETNITLGRELHAIGGLERVVEVKSLAQFRAIAEGRKEGNVVVLRQRPEGETPAANAQSGPRPLLVVWVETSELLELSLGMVVEAA